MTGLETEEQTKSTAKQMEKRVMENTSARLKGKQIDFYSVEVDSSIVGGCCHKNSVSTSSREGRDAIAQKGGMVLIICCK